MRSDRPSRLSLAGGRYKRRKIRLERNRGVGLRSFFLINEEELQRDTCDPDVLLQPSRPPNASKHSIDAREHDVEYS